MKFLYWMPRPLWLIGQPPGALALAALMFAWFKIGNIGQFMMMTIMLMLFIAIVYCLVLKRKHRDEAKAADTRRAHSWLS